MAIEWPAVKLGELVTFKTGKLDSNAAVPDGDYPFFTCSQETLRTNTYSFDTECVLLAGNNANGIFPLKYFHGKFDAYQRTYVVKPRDTGALSTKFLYYALHPKLSEFRSFSTGAATKFLTLTILNETRIQVPPLNIQRRVAGILSAYDEMIENSRRRIKILDAMVRALYREWFVRFRFPGHEEAPYIASPLGEIPKGWEVRGIAEALRFESGKAIKRGERESGGTPVYGANGIIGETVNPPMAQQGIIVGKIGSCGALHRSHVPCWVTNNAFLVQPALIKSAELAWQVLLDIDFRRYIGGAANPYMPINSFGQHEVLVAPPSLQGEFEAKAGSLRHLVEALSDRIHNLRSARDLLLPRLLSGQIEVEAA